MNAVHNPRSLLFTPGAGTPCLLGASCIWAFSFGLIGNVLSGIPPSLSAAVRLAGAALVFLPFLRRVRPRDAAALAALGAVQFGVMTLCYMASFAYLKSHEVALFTVMTPVYVSLLNDAQRRRLDVRNLLAALLSVAGAAVILWRPGASLRRSLAGFLLVEASNLCFAAGQTGYRLWAERSGAPKADARVFFWLYAGAALVTAVPLAFRPPALPEIRPAQWLVLAYLSVVVSGLSYLLWNAGARRADPGVLAVANNLKVPLGVAVSLLFFGERAPVLPLLAGSVLILAGFLAVSGTRAKGKV